MSCAKGLICTANSVGDVINPVAQPSLFAGEAALTNSDTGLKELAMQVANILQKSIEVRVHFVKNFERHRIDMSQKYDESHRYGLANSLLRQMTCLRNRGVQERFFLEGQDFGHG